MCYSFSSPGSVFGGILVLALLNTGLASSSARQRVCAVFTVSPGKACCLCKVFVILCSFQRISARVVWAARGQAALTPSALCSLCALEQAQPSRLRAKARLVICTFTVSVCMPGWATHFLGLATLCLLRQHAAAGSTNLFCRCSLRASLLVEQVTHASC